jgi:hypothetical protein
VGRRPNQKVFDETKIKLSESKAWASSQAAKISQANALCLAHNLLLAYEHKLEREESIANVAEKKRRNQRLEVRRAAAANKERVLNLVEETVQRITQRSVKFIRWLREVLRLETPREDAFDYLRLLYQTL